MWAFIEPGQSSGTYTLRVPSDNNMLLRVYYVYEYDEPYLERGYYSIIGTRWQSDLATLLAGGRIHGDVNLNLLKGTVISGTVSLPHGQTAPENGMELDVQVSEKGNPEQLADVQRITIPNGQVSATYSVLAPDDTDAFWAVRYLYTGFGDYLAQGYFAEETTQPYLTLATFLSGGIPHAGIDITLIPTQDTDSDGIFDYWEAVRFGVLTTADGTTDYDRDGYSDLQEYLNELGSETDPQAGEFDPKTANAPGGTGYIDYDTDDDGLLDAWEVTHFGDLTTADGTTDYDRDGYSDLQEYLNGLGGETDPQGGRYDPTKFNAPGGTGYISVDEGFWELMIPVIINNAREAAAR